MSAILNNLLCKVLSLRDRTTAPRHACSCLSYFQRPPARQNQDLRPSETNAETASQMWSKVVFSKNKRRAASRDCKACQKGQTFDFLTESWIRLCQRAYMAFLHLQVIWPYLWRLLGNQPPSNTARRVQFATRLNVNKFYSVNEDIRWVYKRWCLGLGERGECWEYKVMMLEKLQVIKRLL